METKLPVDEKALLSYTQDVDGTTTHMFAKALIYALVDVHDEIIGNKILKQGLFISINEVSNQGGNFSQHDYNVDGNNIVAFNTMGSSDESNLVVHFQSLLVVNEIYGAASPIPPHDTLMFSNLETMIVEKLWAHETIIDHIIFFSRPPFQS